MAQEKSPSGASHDAALPSRAEEARNLAKEAVEEMKHGNKEEGDFLMAEAKTLDPAAVKEIARESGKK